VSHLIANVMQSQSTAIGDDRQKPTLQQDGGVRTLSHEKERRDGPETWGNGEGETGKQRAVQVFIA